jgi:hypothetical protein
MGCGIITGMGTWTTQIIAQLLWSTGLPQVVTLVAMRQSRDFHECFQKMMCGTIGHGIGGGNGGATPRYR